VDEIRVNVIVPTFNRAQELRQALDSLRHQTFREFSVIVVDDGSTDETRKVVDEFRRDLNLEYLYQPNSGLPACARNYGLESSAAEIVAFLDSDDLWKPKKLELSVELIDRGADVVFHDLVRFTSRPRSILARRVKSRSLSEPSFQSLLLRGNVIPNSSVVLRRRCIESVGLFDESPEVKAWEDYDLWLRLASRGVDFRRLNRCLGGYRVDPGSLSKTVDSGRILNAIQTRYPLAESRPALWIELGMGDYLVRCGEFKRGRRCLIRAAFLPGSSRLRGDRLRALVFLMRSLGTIPRSTRPRIPSTAQQESAPGQR
jgi:glycosyltransferase involved in cell wall biosynthesis